MKLGLGSFARAFAGLALAACAVGCSGGDDAADGERELAVSGRWELPSDIRAAVSDVRVQYDDAPAWGSRRCAGSLTAGAQSLGERLMGKFASVKSIGGYACRQNTANASRMSVHGTGRALDVFIPVQGGRANSAAGDPVANWLVRNAADIGVQLVIWNRTSWMANGSGTRAYSGPNPHVDHIHVELNLRASQKLTPFFQGGVGASAEPAPSVAPATPAQPAPTPTQPPAPTTQPTQPATPPAPVAEQPESPEPPHGMSAPGAGPVLDDHDHDHDDEASGDETSSGLGVRGSVITATGGEEQTFEDAGCSASPKRSGSPLGLVAVGLTLVALRRRRSRPSV